MKDLRPLLVAALALGTVFTANAAAHFTKHDQQLLAEASFRGDATVTLLIAAAPGANRAVVGGIARLGGTVRYRDDGLGYIRARVPIAQAEAVAKLPEVQAANLDEMVPKPDPRPDVSGDTFQVDPPTETTPALNPYMPTRDTGAAQFTEANPTFDGRGVTVGIVDTGVTLDHPALQTTTTGQPKIVDWVTATDPIDDNDPTWINMQTQVSGKTFTYNDVTYTAPAGGNYRIGLLDERDPRLGGEIGNDLNRDRNPTNSSGLFAVLWDTSKNLVWVDANQNNSFADEPAMTDYKVRHDIGTFGTDNPATGIAEAIRFTVQTDGKDKFVNIGIVSSSHGSHVAGIVAAKNLFGGPANGAAPGAQLVSCRACLFVEGCTAHAMIEGMIYAVKQANVDVVNMSIGGLPALNDGNNTRAVLYNRLIDQFKAQMFLSAGNDGSGLNTVGDPGVAAKVVCVGAYFHKDTLLSNYGNVAAKDDNIFPFSSRGPSENGGFKPNIIAPGAAVSCVPLWQPVQPVGGTYALPPGYGMFNGTSMSSPQSAGAAALLVSAAKQRGVQWKPDQLRQAIYSSARYLQGYGAYEQGNGLLQVGAAWDLLQKNIKTVQISSAAPVNTIISQFLSPANEGPGIYEREGWSPGQSATRNIVFRRTSGGGRAVNYNVTWVDNDGTFSSAGTIALPLNAPVTLAVNISPASAGIHSALLNLDDPNTPGIDYQVLNTVAAATDLATATGYAFTQPGGADRHDKKSFVFRVPPGTPAFQVDTTAISGRVRVLRFHPYGVPFDSPNTAFQTGGTISRTLANPTPGVWEVTIETSRASASPTATYNVTGSLLGVSVTPALLTLDPTGLGATNTQNYTFQNLLAAFTGNAVGGSLGSAFTARPSISTGQQQLYAVDVPAGSDSLRVKINNPSDLGADLDLYVIQEADGVPGLSAGDALVGLSADG
ncbi:MAG TPA: S8 family serine peptidase, partial [Verrucomicrobiae bacterium]